jgi:hypothetical protein
MVGSETNFYPKKVAVIQEVAKNFLTKTEPLG